MFFPLYNQQGSVEYYFDNFSVLCKYQMFSFYGFTGWTDDFHTAEGKMLNLIDSLLFPSHY